MAVYEIIPYNVDQPYIVQKCSLERTNCLKRKGGEDALVERPPFSWVHDH